MQLVIRLKGGPGSGFKGHAGRPGKVGGSQASGQTLGDMMPEAFGPTTIRGPFGDNDEMYLATAEEFGLLEAEVYPYKANENYNKLKQRIKQNPEGIRFNKYKIDENGKYVVDENYDYVKTEYNINPEQVNYILGELKKIRDKRVVQIMENLGLPPNVEDFVSQFDINPGTDNYYSNKMGQRRFDVLDKMALMSKELLSNTDVTSYTSRELEYDAFALYDEQIAEKYGDDSEIGSNMTSWIGAMSYALQAEGEFQIKHQICLGNIHPDYASKMGYAGMTQGNGWEELPSEMWHVTTNRAAVEADQLRSRRELVGQGAGFGLAGGEDDTISFTGDYKIAVGIERAIQEAHLVARGDIKARDLFRMAQHGIGTNGKPYLKSFISSIYGSDLDYIPEDYNFFSDDAREHFSGLWDVIDMEEGRKPAEVRGYSRDNDPIDWVNEKRWDWYHMSFVRSRQINGGPMDPVFFGTKWRGLRAMNPENISIVHVKSKTGSRGYQMGSLGEWRTVGGDTVEYWGFEDNYTADDILAEDGVTP